MEIRSLSRSDFLQSARDLRGSRLDLSQRIQEDERLFAGVPGNTFGEMAESADRMADQEILRRRLWFGGQAAFTLAGGYLGLSSVAAMFHGTAGTLIASPATGLAVGLALVGCSYYCRRQVEEQKVSEEAALNRCQRFNDWHFLLQEAERQAAERNAQTRTSVERLADGLKESASGILMKDDSLQVGGVRVKRKLSGR